jgi:ABC-type multidrug transport system fused ATPase/permease subunit
MFHHFLDLLRPYRPHYRRFIAGTVLRQALIVLGGYSLVWVLRVCLAHTEISEWIFVAAFLLFDSVYLRFDNSLNYFFSARVSYPLFKSLRVRALDKLLDMPAEWHQRQSSGELVGQVNNGVGKVVQTAEGISRELVPALIQTGFSLVPLFIFTPRTTPLLLASVVLFLWLTVIEQRQRKPFAKSRYKGYNRDFGYFTESVQAVQPVVQYGQQGHVLAEYQRIQQRIVDDGLSEAIIANRIGFQRNLVTSIARRACQGIWIWQYRHHALDAAMIMYLNMLTEQLLGSFAGYASLLERIYDGIEPTRTLVDILHEKPSVADHPNAAPVDMPEVAGIRIRNAGFAYPKRKAPVLQDFNLNIAPGTVLGIVGRSGCGKTTIYNLLTRVFDVQSGSVEICGMDVRLWPLEQLRGSFSYVSQSGGVFFSGMRILDVIRFTRPEATLAEAMDAARAACIHDEIARLPQKYNTRLGEGGVSLSKGQQQRIALAQALIAMDHRRKILMLDEFTSALDSETEERILRNIEPWLVGRTTIIIAHRLSTVRKLADKIVVLDRDGIVEQGTHSSLLAQNGWYAEMARLQDVGADEIPMPRRRALQVVG